MLEIKISENTGGEYFPIHVVKNVKNRSENGTKERKNECFCNQI